MSENEIRVLYVQPGKYPEERTMSFLPSMRKRINLKAVRIYILHRSFAADCWMIWPSP